MGFCFVSFASKTTYTQNKRKKHTHKGFNQTNYTNTMKKRNNYKVVVDDGDEGVLSFVRVDGK
jgi:hypothetical protein